MDMEFKKSSNIKESIKIEKISGKGRGITTTHSINNGELIEAAPVCAFPPEHRKIIDETTLSKYCFVMPSEYSCGGSHANGHIVFGLSSFCNHAAKPNVEIEWITDDIGQWAYLRALRDIHPGEELTMFYTNIDEYPSADKFVGNPKTAKVADGDML